MPEVLMPWGLYRGMPLREIDTWFLSFLLYRRGGLCETALAVAVRNELDRREDSQEEQER